MRRTKRDITPNKTVRTHLVIWFLIFALVPLLTGAVIIYIQQRTVLQQDASDRILAVSDLKVQQAESWIRERMEDMETISSDDDLSVLEDPFPLSKDDPGYKEKYKSVQDLIQRYLRNHRAYEEIFIMDPDTGNIEFSTKADSVGLNRSQKEYFKSPLQTNERYVSNLYNSQMTGEPTIIFSIPIFSRTSASHRIIGILAMRGNLNQSSFMLVVNKVGLGTTGGIMIVSSDMETTNEIYWYEGVTLQLNNARRSEVLTAKGATGVVRTVDYRGVEILTTYTPIKGTDWGFIVKQDVSEIDEPLAKLLQYSIMLVLVLILIAILFASMVSRKFTRPLLMMRKVSLELGKGDFSVRNNIHTGNEFELLADSINMMAQSVESKTIIQTGVARIAYVMIDQSSVQGFSSNLLKELVKTTKANIGALYIADESHTAFEPFSTFGVNREILKPFSVEKPEGELARAVEEKTIVHLMDIPEDTVFTFKAVAGEMVPKEIITIPVVIDDAAVAVISIMSIHQFSDTSCKILEQSWMNINSSFSSLFAVKKTQDLAVRLASANQELEVHVEELQDQAEELWNQAEELQNKDEIMAKNRQLADQQKEVEEANRLKSEFISNMSHELRTPLNSIMALSKVLIMQASDKLSEEENNYLTIIERNGKQLLSLINEILDLSKIEAGKVEMHPSRNSVDTIITQIKDSLSPLAKEKGIEIRVRIAEGTPPIETDEAKLHQILLNIINNAVKFTDTGFVDVSTTYDDANLTITIADTGIGISKKDLPRIFEEFRQVDGSLSRHYEGTGLGLAIAKKMVINLYGEINVTSEIGRGTVFTVVLPILWQGKKITANTPLINKEFFSTEKQTILVVDDNPQYVRKISQDLEDNGYMTLRATSGKEALMIVERQIPYAILLDVIMPELDGWEVLQVLKSKPETRDIPVIIVSVSDGRDTAFALGAVGYLQKPIDKDTMIAEINKLHDNQKSIMVVDDDDMDRRQLVDIVSSISCNITEASSGEECLRLLHSAIPDLLVLDLYMPGINGFDVINAIRKEEETKDLPIVVVMARDLSGEEREEIAGKVSSFVKKRGSIRRELLQEIRGIVFRLHDPRSEYNKKSDGRKFRILVVEDNEVTVIQVRKVLEDENYIVDIAMGGRQALTYLEHHRPDGMILDLKMPEVDGFEVLKKIRSSKETRRLPVLVLTAKELSPEEFGILGNNNVKQVMQKGNVDIKDLLLQIRLMLRKD